MKLIPGKACLTCISDGFFCNCKDWSEYIPICSENNYEDEAIELLIIECENHEGAGIKGYQWQKTAIKLIEKVKNKKWEVVKNEINK